MKRKIRECESWKSKQRNPKNVKPWEEEKKVCENAGDKRTKMRPAM